MKKFINKLLGIASAASLIIGGCCDVVNVSADSTGYGNGARDLIYESVPIELPSGMSVEDGEATILQWVRNNPMEYIVADGGTSNYPSIPTTNAGWQTLFNEINNEGRFYVEFVPEERTCYHYLNIKIATLGPAEAYEWGYDTWEGHSNKTIFAGGGTFGVSGVITESRLNINYTMPAGHTYNDYSGHSEIYSFRHKHIPDVGTWHCDPVAIHGTSKWLAWGGYQECVSVLKGTETINGAAITFTDACKAIQGTNCSIYKAAGSGTKLANGAFCQSVMGGRIWRYNSDGTYDLDFPDFGCGRGTLSSYKNGSRYDIPNDLLSNHTCQRGTYCVAPSGASVNWVNGSVMYLSMLGDPSSGGWGVHHNVLSTVVKSNCFYHSNDGKCAHTLALDDDEVVAAFDNGAVNVSHPSWHHDITTYTVKVYRLNNYTITYHGNGGAQSDGTDVFTQVTLRSSDTNIGNNRFSKTGYTFVKWNTKEDGTGTSYNPGDLYTNREDLDLYAIWEPIKYNVNVHPNKPSDATNNTNNIK